MRYIIFCNKKTPNESQCSSRVLFTTSFIYLKMLLKSFSARSGVRTLDTLIKSQADLDEFKKMYGIDGEIEKEY